MESKRCTKCGVIKELSEYNVQSLAKGGKASECRLCNKKRSRKFYQEHKQKCQDASKKWRDLNPERTKELNNKNFKKWVAKHKDLYRERRKAAYWAKKSKIINEQ